jgi:aspartyl-tRNA(Asn)/glutamyl-tRNA(Gln) amidotransferase subunit A
MTITEAGAKLRARHVSCAELVEDALQRAERGRDLSAFITITADQARSRARQLDDELKNGADRGPLHGIPIAYKDLFYTKGVRSTNGSKIFADFVPSYDATVVQKLEAAGAISIGKLNQHEMAYGITSTNPHYGAVRNPHNPEHIPGGSSGGSGVTVADGTVFCGMGSDTGGSIRIPAAFCGTVGLKPTFGRVSRHGCFALGLTLDHMGPLTRTVRDAALILNVIAGADPEDEATVNRPPERFDPVNGASLRGVRVGVPENYYNERLDPEVASAYRRALESAESAGAVMVPVTIPDPVGLTAIARTILLAEASAVLAPYLSRREDFGSDVMSLLDQGSLLPATAYVNSQRIRRQLIREYNKLWTRADVIFAPATPGPAPRIGQRTVTLGGEEEDARLAATRFNRGINVLGWPAMSIPCGSSGNLPVGLQIIGKPWGERAMIACAAAMEAELSSVAIRLPGA